MKSIHYPCCHSLLAIVLAPLLGIATANAGPRDELLRLVPDDMAFCAVVQDLRERTKNATDHSIAVQIAKLPFVQAAWNSPEAKKVLDIERQLLRDLQLTREQLRDELLGDALVFAYRPGQKDNVDRDKGVFMVWARDKALLIKVVDRINEVQQKKGELTELKELTYNEQTYWKRVEAKKQENENAFYFVRGNALVFSPQESLLKEVIDRDRKQPAADKQPPFWSKMLARLGLDKPLMALLVNPRAFDGDLKAQETGSKADERAFVKEFRKYWQAIDALGLYADANESFELGFAVHVRKDALPKAAREFFTELGKPSELWKAIPDDALFAASSRIDLPRFAEVFAGFCDQDRLNEIGKTFENSIGNLLIGAGKLEALKNGLGPDWGLWAFAPAPDDKTWVPQVILAVKVRDNADGVAAEKAIGELINSAITAARWLSKSPLRLDVLKQDKVEIKYLVHDTAFPPGIRPAFAFKQGFLLFAGSPETIRRFSIPEKGNDRMDEVPLFYMSAKGWRNYLSNYKNDVAGLVEKMTGTPAQKAASQIAMIADNLKAFDRFEVVVKSKPDQATLVFRLKGAGK
jgi:hypothetical protein